jgi:hypothetical protein
LALGGQHQPQHLLILTHMLSIGMKFDVVVFFATPQSLASAAENVRYGLAADYPDYSAWLGLTRALEEQAAAEPIDLLNLTLAAGARRAQSWIDGCGMASCVVALRPLLNIQKSFRDKLGPRTVSIEKEQPHFFSASPPDPEPDTGKRYLQALGNWQRSVELMDEVTRQSGAAFFMYLLPSPWDHPSGNEPKIASSDRRETIRDYAGRSLSALKRGTKELAGAGIHAIDATRLVDDLPLNFDLYLDEAGHFGHAGLKRISEQMAETIVRETTLAATSRIGPWGASPDTNSNASAP